MMAAKPNIKFMARGGGAVHVVTTKREDVKHSKCPQVKKGHEDGVWRGKGLSPEAALDLKSCSRCVTHEVAAVERKSRMTPAQKRAESRQKSDETRSKIAKGSKKDKPAKEKAAPKRRGPKGGDATEKMKANVEEHAALAKEHGWKVKVGETDTNEWTCEATRNGETLKLIYRDGRTVWSRVVLASGVEVRLRNSSNWRKHATGEAAVKADYSPRARQGKKATKAQTIDDSAPRQLPFSLEDDDDTIIESLMGKTIVWRNSVSNKLDTSTLPHRGRNIRVTTHPKSDRRMVSFHEYQGQTKRGDEMVEQLGGERTVYLDKILKAR